MNKRAILAAVAIVVTAALLTVWILPPSSQPEQKVFFDDFENDFGIWITDSNVPQDPNNPGEPVAWAIERVPNSSFSGEYSTLMRIDGRQDDGTIWIERKVASPGASPGALNA